MLKRLLLVLLFCFAMSSVCQAESLNKRPLHSATRPVLGEAYDTNNTIKGIKDALTLGTQHASSRCSAVDGFYRSQLIKIPFPRELSNMQSKLRQIGSGEQIDEFDRRMNRTAEYVARYGNKIFEDAIRKLIINDPKNIISGGNTAATYYLDKMSRQILFTSFKPIVSNGMKINDADRCYNALVNKYKHLPDASTNLQDFDIEAYITNKFLDGFLLTLGAEETKIRYDPSNRLLKN